MVIIMELLSNMATFFGIFFAVYEYLKNRQAKTVDKLEELNDFFFEKEEGENDYMHKIHYMNKLNRFADAVHRGIYSKKIVKERASRLLIKHYYEFIKEYIPERRKMYSNPDYYRNIEKLVEYLEK